MFQVGEFVEFSDRYTEGYGIVRYHSDINDKVMIDLNNGESVYLPSEFVESV